MNARLSLNIHALSRSVIDSDVKVISDVKVLSGCVVNTGCDRDASAVGRVVSKVDAEFLTGGGVDYPDLGSTEVVVEQLNIRGVA